ncbi:hypothetical protein ALP72_02775 [Pseudomonas coronafaciens pv. coronafaciens]|nr:hypothetical protein ALP72_02775 [Pseudomonas coronafaciens pv. coronafaciens]
MSNALSFSLPEDLLCVNPTADAGIPIDAIKATLNGFDDAAALSDALKARVAKYYGTPLTAFLTALCEPDKRHAWSAILRRTLEGFIAQSLFRGMNINAVNKELLQRGVIEPGNDGKASSLVRLPGLGTQRCYIVKTIPGLAESEARAA